MAETLRASRNGLEQIDRARRRLGWNRQSTAWYAQAHTSLATLKRFLRGEPIDRDAFIELCQIVGVRDWQTIADPSFLPLSTASSLPVVDWEEAPDVRLFFGRESELATLEHWIVGDRCRLVTVLGRGSIGKTALVVRLIEQIQDQFEVVIWRSLRQAPPLPDLLQNLLQFLTYQPPTAAFPIHQTLSQLIEQLRQHRCLLVLDNGEAILKGESLTGQYLEGYEEYSELFRRVGTERHQSCLLLTSREMGEIARLAGNRSPVRMLPLTGLAEPDARQIFQAEHLSGQEKWATLIAIYQGDPLALRLISTTIKEVFDGNVAAFLKGLTIVVDKLRDTLDQQFQRLSAQEKAVMGCLAIADQPVSISQLTDRLDSRLSQSEVIQVLESLKGRSLIENTKIDEDEEVLFTLQPVIQKYVTRYHLETAGNIPENG
ncbi:NACHT domain-containing protein [Phormidesmis priestleyi ULC007]|uniref:NACHT domain-containing protein n=1 Tax=Phormidesmis priestleyi ULC007 TaxID=1920490 RepID=A0A2T1DL39_9CYAN|nr:NB-ARC domain-containing protein [Phormidesmis priestleyi]PSB21196.1 NACHT domain-containing protein [Phormidesmis priestleyi ULC007]PZO51276.1 MAG: NACHT domain-containing protein [Phormidesmis priestleyi]